MLQQQLQGQSSNQNELQKLQSADIPALRVFADTAVKASSVTGALPETYYPTEVTASDLHVGGVPRRDPDPPGGAAGSGPGASAGGTGSGQHMVRHT